jgi:hypothetical protein
MSTAFRANGLRERPKTKRVGAGFASPETAGGGKTLGDGEGRNHESEAAARQELRRLIERLGPVLEALENVDAGEERAAAVKLKVWDAFCETLDLPAEIRERTLRDAGVEVGKWITERRPKRQEINLKRERVLVITPDEVAVWEKGKATRDG